VALDLFGRASESDPALVDLHYAPAVVHHLELPLASLENAYLQVLELAD
jgi:hypothetical protein